MPYRIDVPGGSSDVGCRLVDLGALDVASTAGGIAAIMPDTVGAGHVRGVLGVDVRVTPAPARDDGSVWVLTPREVRVGRFIISPVCAGGPRTERPQEGTDSPGGPDSAGGMPDVVRLIDGPAFGTGMHATTAMCLAALDHELHAPPVARVLDVGTGSGILALAALSAGVARVTALDIDQQAVHVAAENAHINGLRGRLSLVCGSINVLSGAWPLVLANVLAAPLIQMAPALARVVGHQGRLVLSGVRQSLVDDVEQPYRRLGFRCVRSHAQEGWSALVFHASW